MTPFPLLRASLAAAVAAAALAACASPAAPSAALAAHAAPARDTVSADDAVRYHASLGMLDAAGLAREYAAVSSRFAGTGDAFDRVRLAILLALPDTPFRNAAAARELLKGVPPATSSLRDFARLLDELLAAEQRAGEASSGLAQALAAEKARTKALQGKIEAIKDMEINLHKEQP